MKEQTIPQNARQDSEFSLCAVPESERKSYISLTIIWTGFIFAIISPMARLPPAIRLMMAKIKPVHGTELPGDHCRQPYRQRLFVRHRRFPHRPAGGATS